MRNEEEEMEKTEQGWSYGCGEHERGICVRSMNKKNECDKKENGKGVTGVGKVSV